MKRTISTILCLLLFVVARAQLYVPGETLHYRMSYKAALFPNTEVAKVMIQTTEATLDGRDVYKVYGVGQTARAFNWIFPVKDAYTIWVEPSTLRTLRFDADLQEGDYTRKSTFIFDQPNGKVYTRWQTRQRPMEYRTLDITEKGMDAISLYFNMRSVDDSEIKEGFTRYLEMVLEDTVRYLRFRYEGREVKKIKNLGRFNTLRFRCKIATSDGYAFKDGTEFEVWISDDRNKIPLYIQSPIKVGSVQAYLSSYEGLRYPLDSFIKK